VSNDLPSNLSSFYTSTAGGLFYSGFAGFNYWLSQNFAVQARVGYFPYVGVGITYSM